MTPDGRRYLMAAERRVARPFHYRWLLSAVCGTRPRRWIVTAYTSAVLFTTGVAVYSRSWWAIPLVAGWAGTVRFNVRNPILVDLPAMAAAVWAANAADHRMWWAAVPLVLLAGAIKETSPVFAALWAWHPALLIGLVPVAVRHLQPAGDDCLDDENRWILDHPVRASVKYHRPLPAWVWVLPWGAGLVAVPELGLGGWVCVAVAYCQCAVATDTVRLYQWAAPVMAAATVGAVDPRWWPVIAAVHLVNPFRTEGV